MRKLIFTILVGVGLRLFAWPVRAETSQAEQANSETDTNAPAGAAPLPAELQLPSLTNTEQAAQPPAPPATPAPTAAPAPPTAPPSSAPRPLPTPTPPAK